MRGVVAIVAAVVTTAMICLTVTGLAIFYLPQSYPSNIASASTPPYIPLSQRSCAQLSADRESMVQWLESAGSWDSTYFTLHGALLYAYTTELQHRCNAAIIP